MRFIYLSLKLVWFAFNILLRIKFRSLLHSNSSEIVQTISEKDHILKALKLQK